MIQEYSLDDNFGYFDANSKSSYPFLNDLGLDQDVVRRLSMHLDGTYEGNTQVLVTPLCKSRTPESILSDWDDIFNANRHKMNEPLLGLENSNREKFGPRSIALPWKDRIPSVSEYFGPDSCKFPSGYLFPQHNSSEFARLRPLSIDRAIDYLKNNTNSGLPYYTRKGKIKSRVVERFHELLNRKDPCILFTRTQEQSKTRTVWGYPIADTLNETRFYRPLLSHQEKLDWRAALRGPGQVDIAMTRLIDMAVARGLKIVSLDLKAYDANFKKRIQEASFSYIKSLFQKEFWDDIDYIKDRFNTIGIVTPSGVITGNHGVPSGSTFTNEVDSIGQYLVAQTSGPLESGSFQIQGDDGAYAKREKDISDFFESFSLCGEKVNVDKTYISDNFAVYLQCLYHTDYRDKRGLIGGIYPTYRALNRLIFQERWSGFEDYDLAGKDYYSLRAISILENVKYHPLFKEFVQFIQSLDKYSLRVSRKSIDKYVEYVTDSPGAEGTLINQYGDDLKGIRSFETWKLLNKS